ncbi:MAG TPA: hypothetical protein PLY56_17320, partial [Armatimonadota bacterium]|nr:hypothetical protein [Armatimonadota bacterium]
RGSRLLWSWRRARSRRSIWASSFAGKPGAGVYIHVIPGPRYVIPALHLRMQGRETIRGLACQPARMV